ncbi:hypothetical protein R3P38DRAFT_3326035 [Favolaschia claudopus]|uniref:Uncharacterized protein n=1 Tax=Favolaschia claudopus TaxID=2862362 RepID=A0AAW0AAI8_9AGAR
MAAVVPVPVPVPAAAVAAPLLCDYCHQKPKHGTHSYCSKTCAAQTATLCNYCQKKPKFQNFDFCGKACAAAAAGATGTRPAKSNGAGAPTRPAARAPGGNGPAAPVPQPATNPLLDPLHIASMPSSNLVAQHIPTVAQHIPAVAQHLPQVQSFLAAVGVPSPAAAPQPAVAPVPALAPAPAAAPQPKQPRNNPFLNSTKQAAAAPNTNAAPGQSLDCLIPGCGQPAYVDASGNSSDYCSMKHREEAVTSGLVPGCIMCLILPQSGTDYFCGKECRDEAMSKPPAGP